MITTAPAAVDLETLLDDLMVVPSHTHHDAAQDLSDVGETGRANRFSVGDAKELARLGEVDMGAYAEGRGSLRFLKNL
jgi:hypothetical protein